MTRKRLVARREIRIESLTAIASVLPSAVPVFQLVTKRTFSGATRLSAV